MKKMWVLALLIPLVLTLCITARAADSNPTDDYNIDGEEVYLHGNPAVIRSKDGTDSDTNLVITYTKNGEEKTFEYNSTTAARVIGGYKHPPADLDTTQDEYTITVESGKLDSVRISSKGRKNPSATNITMKGGTINVNGGDIGVVAAGWYYNQNMDYFTVNVTDGKVGKIYGGGESSYTASTDLPYKTVTYNTVAINISGGQIDEVYGGGRALTQADNSAEYSMVTKNATIDITGGTIGYVNAGGFSGPNANWGEATGQDTVIVENATVNVSGGTVQNVFGGGFNGQWKWTHKIDADGNLEISNYNGEKTIAEARNQVYNSTINISDNANITNVYGGGRSYSHVDNAVVNVTGGNVATLSTSGNYGYVDNSSAKISGGTITKLELLTRNYVGDIDVDVVGGTVSEFYAGVGGAYKNSNCIENDTYNVSTMDILGDVSVTFASGAEPTSAYLTTGLEQANSVSISVPVVMKTMDLAENSGYTGNENKSGEFTIENTSATWNVAVDAKEGESFYPNGVDESKLVVLEKVTAGPNDVAVSGVELDKASITLEVGKTASLVATVSPANATNKVVQWYSDNTAIATVDQNGVVTVVGNGSVKITVRTKEGGFEAVCNVTSHTHAWSATWMTNGTHHWHECTTADCPVTDDTQKNGYALHSGTDDNNCATEVKCECGYIITAAKAHDFATGATYKQETDGHSKKCANCEVYDTKAAHSSTGNNMATYTKKAVCDVCGIEYGELKERPAGGGGGTPTPDKTVESPNTFDPGIAVYGMMALASACGAAYVSKKR